MAAATEEHTSTPSPGQPPSSGDDMDDVGASTTDTASSEVETNESEHSGHASEPATEESEHSDHASEAPTEESEHSEHDEHAPATEPADRPRAWLFGGFAVINGSVMAYAAWLRRRTAPDRNRRREARAAALAGTDTTPKPTTGPAADRSPGTPKNRNDR